MIVLALSTNQVAWWATIGAGLVVALVVWALLEALRRTVAEVDRAVSQVWTMGKRVAQNTQTTHLLQATRTHGLELLEELQAHRPPAMATVPASARAVAAPAAATKPSAEPPPLPRHVPPPAAEPKRRRRFPWIRR